MFALPSQATAGMFASKEAGLRLKSPAKSRKSPRNLRNRMILTDNIRTLQPKSSTCNRSKVTHDHTASITVYNWPVVSLLYTSEGFTFAG